MFRKQKEIIGHSGAIYCCDYDTEFLYTGAADKFVTRWNLEKGIQDKFSIQFPFSVYAIKKIEDFLFVGLSNGSIHVFDLKERRELKHFTQHIKAVFSITYNSVKKHVYSADADGNFVVWDLVKLTVLLYLPIDCGKIRRMEVSEEGDFILLGGQDGKLRIIETNGYNEIYTSYLHEGGITVCRFDPEDISVVYTGGKDAWLRKINWKKDQLISEVPAHNFAVYDLIFLGKSNFVTASRDKNIKLWEKRTMNVVQRLDFKAGGHRHSVNVLGSLSAGTFASAGDDKKIVIWEEA